jgi:hypothetical protein
MILAVPGASGATGTAFVSSVRGRLSHETAEDAVDGPPSVLERVEVLGAACTPKEPFVTAGP